MLRNTRTKLLAAFVAALVLSSLVLSAGAGAQRGGAARQANQNARGGQSKRVIVGRGSESRQGSRVTITADDSLKDYSAYRSGDRFYVVLPKSAAGAAGRGGSGRGYTDMQVQQRGDSVVLSYRVQPGAKPRVEQKFNRLDVVFDVPEGGAQPQAAASNDARRAQQPPPVETRNQNPAAQQQPNQANAVPPATSPNTAAERAAAERAARQAEAERAQAANAANAANAAATPPVMTAAPPTAAVDPNAQPGATPANALTQEAAPAATPADEPQLAQAQPPAAAAPVSITKPDAAQPTGASLGTFLLRNWALMLIFALVVVGLGLVIAARRTTAATPPTVEGADADDVVTNAVTNEGARAARVREASTAALGVATTTAKASTAAKATASEETLVTAKPPTPATAEASTPATVEASTPAAAESLTHDAAVPSTPDVAEVSGVDAKPLVAASALAAGVIAAKSRKQSRKDARQESRKKKKGTRADSPATEEISAAAPLAQEPPVEESARESFVEKSDVEETVSITPAVEAARAEDFTATSAAVEEPAAEEASVASEDVTLAGRTDEIALPLETSVAPAFAETSTVEVAEIAAAPAAEVAEPLEVADVANTFDAAEETAAVETEAASAPEAAPAVSDITPVVPVFVETEAAEPRAVEAGAAASVTGIEPAFAPEPERVQEETRLLLEGGAYDRAVIGTRDPVARQMIAAELLSALAGRNAQRRERAGAVFVEQGYYDETARDLREADAPAERAAAARSLALFGDRAATPLLISALEDQTLDVRRAAVEALGALRDPAAVAPLEALLERERSERNRIPPRVVRSAVETCREAAAEAAVEASKVEEAPRVSETAVGLAHVAEVERSEVEVGQRDAAASVEVEPVAEAAAETETARSSEVAAREPALESPVSITPFVEEQEPSRQAAPPAEASADLAHIAEPVFVEDGREDEEETLIAEAPAATSAAEVEVDPFVADLTEELNAASASQSLETAVAEPRAVAETGLSPFAEMEESPEEFFEPVAAAPAEEVALEPFREATAEAFPAQTALYDDGAEEEVVTREAAHFRADPAAASGGDVADGEWFDFDIREMREEPSPAAAETTPPPAPARGDVFETSSGETLASHAATDAEPPAAAEPPAFTYTDAEAERDLEAFGARDAAREEVAPVAPATPGEKGLAPFDEFSTVPASIQQRLASRDAGERAAAIVELSHVDTDEAFQQICAGFDDSSKEVRGAAARALYELRADRAESFTRALREATPERRREIGAAISASGLAGESISQLTGESREKTYEAFSLLFLMAKAGEVAPLVRAIEGHPNNEVRLAVVKLLALSGQKEILPAFRRLAVRGSLPTEVRSAVMEAIYQISSSQPTPA
jgi:HEAT repeat protein